MREGRRARIAGAVERGAGGRRLAALVLHDVDLTTLGPRNRRASLPEHPERRPESLTRRQLDPRFDPTGRREHLAARRDLRRGVLARPVVTGESRRSSAGDDLELPFTVQRDVLRRVRVILFFVVAPPADSDLAPVLSVIAPLRGIDVLS